MVKSILLSFVMVFMFGFASSAFAAENLELSHTVFNDTKNKDAVSVQGSREDFLTYKLKAKNNTSIALTNYTLTFDVAGVLPLADVVDLGGGVLSGQKVNFTGLIIQPGQTIEKNVRVRVKAFLPSYQYIATTNFGNVNLVTVEAKGAVAGMSKVTPRTGGAPMLPWIMGAVLAASYGMIKKYRFIRA